MSEVILIQILLVVAIIAGIMLVLVLGRAFQILSDVKGISGIIADRVKDIDQSVQRTKEAIAEFLDGVKGFLYSFGFMQAIKSAIKTNKKGE